MKLSREELQRRYILAEQRKTRSDLWVAVSIPVVCFVLGLLLGAITA